MCRALGVSLLLGAGACSGEDEPADTLSSARPSTGEGDASGGEDDPDRGNGAGGDETAPLGSPSEGNAGTGSGADGSATGGGAGEGSATPEGGSGGSADAATGADPSVRFIGRVDTSDPAGPRFAWSGTGIVARFSGTSVAVQFADRQQYTVLLDGELQPKLVATGGLDVLAADLPAGEHQIELYRRTEASEGESQLIGFDFGDGAALAPPPPAERRIEVIGDSISAGYGNEGADETCTFTPDTENHYLTYGAIAARAVGAELVTVAWSGKGVVCNYGDDPSSCVDPMPVYFDRTLPTRPESSWDFSRYQPQAVVINLGTNDFSTAQDPTLAEFTSAYVTLLERVRSAYPEALILCTVGPLLNGADLANARSGITSAVAERAAAGDDDVRSFELAPQDASNGLGCDYHPSIRTHELMADTLSSVLASELGW